MFTNFLKGLFHVPAKFNEDLLKVTSSTLRQNHTMHRPGSNQSSQHWSGGQNQAIRANFASKCK
jgi:hypothetical protein